MSFNGILNLYVLSNVELWLVCQRIPASNGNEEVLTPQDPKLDPHY